MLSKSSLQNLYRSDVDAFPDADSKRLFQHRYTIQLHSTHKKMKRVMEMILVNKSTFSSVFQMFSVILCFLLRKCAMERTMTAIRKRIPIICEKKQVLIFRKQETLRMLKKHRAAKMSS